VNRRHLAEAALVALAMAACGSPTGGSATQSPAETSTGPCDPVAYYGAPSPSPTEQSPVGYTLVVSQGQTVTRQVQVDLDQNTFAVQVGWSQGDVELKLTSPSGTIYDRSTEDPAAHHHVQANGESFAIDQPEAGGWTMQLFGARVLGSSMAVRVLITQIGNWAFGPIAYVVATPDHGLAPLPVKFSSSNMTFEGATIVGQRWAFGDCSPVDTTATPTHVFHTAGDYTVTVTVTDSNGESDSASRDIHVCNFNLLPCAG